MGLGSAIAIYFVIWWITLFAVLPFGVRTQAEAGDVVPGAPASAPEKTSFLKIASATRLWQAWCSPSFIGCWSILACRSWISRFQANENNKIRISSCDELSCIA
jgi:predicted secreted protein